VVPLNFRAQVKADIEADVMKGILERVPVGKPDSWCSMMVIQERRNGRARRTVDFEWICSILSHLPGRRLSCNFMITEDGIKPAAKYTASVNDFTTPSIISEVRAWNGLVSSCVLLWQN
jgi:hypothetical protein